jgi:hypothetical protein
MKKLIIIFLLIPFACKAQEQHVMSTEDILINVVLENTANYFENKNKKEIEPIEIKPHKKDSIDWNKSEFIKWQITEPKDSLMYE